MAANTVFHTKTFVIKDYNTTNLITHYNVYYDYIKFIVHNFAGANRLDSIVHLVIVNTFSVCHSSLSVCI